MDLLIILDPFWMYFILGARDHYTLLETIIQKNMFIGKSRNATFGVFWANTVVTSSDKKKCQIKKTLSQQQQNRMFWKSCSKKAKSPSNSQRSSSRWSKHIKAIMTKKRLDSGFPGGRVGTCWCSQQQPWSSSLRSVGPARPRALDTSSSCGFRSADRARLRASNTSSSCFCAPVKSFCSCRAAARSILVLSVSRSS